MTKLGFGDQELLHDAIDFIFDEINFQGIEDDLGEEDAWDWGEKNASKFVKNLKKNIAEAIEISLIEQFGK